MLDDPHMNGAGCILEREASMKWDQFGENWNQFKERCSFLRSGSSDRRAAHDPTIEAGSVDQRPEDRLSANLLDMAARG